MISNELLSWVYSGYKFRIVGDGDHTDMYITYKGHIAKTTLDMIAKQFKGKLDWVGVDPDGLTEVKYKIPAVTA